MLTSRPVYPGLLKSMGYYQHYSFDLWLTLIRSNPRFKTERAKIFHRDFNQAKISLEKVEGAFRQVDLMCNSINEKTGKDIDSDEMYLMVICMINDNQVRLADIDTGRLYNHIEGLLFEYPPTLYTDETVDALSRIKEKSRSTFSILSNTGFIKGITLRKVLVDLNLDGYFEFQLYSDEVGLSKPNPAFFKLMLEKTNAVNGGNSVGLEKIIHIGDNQSADVAGAQAVGIKGYLVNSNNTPISSLIDL